MPSCRVCLIHYHEIGLKGHNRVKFERCLIDNLRSSLSPHGKYRPQRISGYLVVVVEDEDAIERIAQVCAAAPGVVKVSVGWRVDRDLGVMEQTALLALADQGEFESFKVAARRSNTDFPLSSMEMNNLIGAALHEAFPEKKVRMKDPDVTVHVTVAQAKAFIWSRDIPGVGGLPVGSAGKVVCLLSAGIDSPVATWRLIRRGAIAIPVHFSGRPQTGDSSEHLVREIIEALSPCAGVGRLYVVPFGDYQRQIALECPPSLRVILYRRLMFAVAQAIAHREGAKAIVTGESLGQVASQTLSNIWATDDAVDMPVFRPLIGSDKTEIIERAQRLGTYDISIRNQSDCCTLFMPRNPETHARLEDVRMAWAKLPIDEWVKRIVEEVETEDFGCPSYHAPRKRGDSTSRETVDERIEKDLG